MVELLKSYAEQEELLASRLASYQADIRCGAISAHVVCEAEARATLDQYLDMIQKARQLMAQRGVPEADFPEMFNSLLLRVDSAAG